SGSTRSARSAPPNKDSASHGHMMDPAYVSAFAALAGAGTAEPHFARQSYAGEESPLTARRFKFRDFFGLLYPNPGATYPARLPVHPPQCHPVPSQALT